MWDGSNTSTPDWQAIADGDTSLPRERVDALVAHEYDKVRERVARHPHVGPEALLVLASDPCAAVRLAVAVRDCGPAALTILARDPDPLVRQRAANHPDLSAEDRAVLRADPELLVRSAAAWPDRYHPVLLRRRRS